MNRFIYFLLSLFLFCNSFTVFAQVEQQEEDRLGAYVETISEQEIMTRWVMENSKNDMTLEKATKIVKNAYTYAINHNIKPSLIIAMIRQESTFNPQARSPAGAKGLMQVIPYWHRDKLRGRNPYAVQVSIEVGSQVIKDCLTKHKQNQRKALSCYSGGARDYAKKIENFQSQAAEYISRARHASDIMVALGETLSTHR